MEITDVRELFNSFFPTISFDIGLLSFRRCPVAERLFWSCRLKVRCCRDVPSVSAFPSLLKTKAPGVQWGEPLAGPNQSVITTHKRWVVGQQSLIGWLRSEVPPTAHSGPWSNRTSFPLCRLGVVCILPFKVVPCASASQPAPAPYSSGWTRERMYPSCF